MVDLVVGLDIGTGGARAVAVDARGKVHASASHISPPPFMDDKGVSEQVPDSWEIAAFTALERCLDELKKSGESPKQVRGICVDGTSGTIVLLDESNRPLYPGIMHNDTRAFVEASELNEILENHCEEVGYRFGATFALPKLLWLKKHRKLLFQRARRVVHQADYLVGKLTGEFGLTDPSNALKTGFNLVRDSWPKELEELEIERLLPQVVPSGTVVGHIRREVAEEFGLSEGTPVLAGVTDSTAAFLASGACRPGEFCISLGTTMAFKGISEDLVRDPGGVVYCHKHPGGKWLPGGASNVGGACLKAHFPNTDYRAWDQRVFSRFPIDVVCYPLVEVGERFPFDAPQAEGFFDPTDSDEDHYLSLLQGVAIVEKWCFERFRRLGMELIPPVYSTGGGAKSDVWNQIRADALQVPVVRCRSTDSGFGVAVLAGSAVFFGGDLDQAVKNMTASEEQFDPRPEFSSWAENMLGILKQRCLQAGWISPEDL